MTEYKTLPDSASEDDALLGGQYTATVYEVRSGYALLALNKFDRDVDATEMAEAASKADLVGKGAVTALLHHSAMGVVDPRQLTVGDQIAVRLKEFTDDGWRAELSETIDVTRSQIAGETGPGYDKTPPWEGVEICERCGKEFDTVRGLNIHFGQVHKDGEEEEPDEYECVVCGESFPSKMARGAHMKAHSKAEVRHAEEANAQDVEPTPFDEAFADGGALADYRDVESLAPDDADDTAFEYKAEPEAIDLVTTSSQVDIPMEIAHRYGVAVFDEVYDGTAVPTLVFEQAVAGMTPDELDHALFALIKADADVEELRSFKDAIDGL